MNQDINLENLKHLKEAFDVGPGCSLHAVCCSEQPESSGREVSHQKAVG